MLIIDRFEGDFAVCELDGGHKNIPLQKIDGTPREGDVLIENGERYEISKEETARRRRKMIERQRNLFGR